MTLTIQNARGSPTLARLGNGWTFVGVEESEMHATNASLPSIFVIRAYASLGVGRCIELYACVAHDGTTSV